VEETEYTLSYLPLFKQDLEQTVSYITDKLYNPQAAAKLVEDTEKAILMRLKAPLAFEPYPSKKNRTHPYYRIQIRNYLVFYVVIGNVMEVRRFLYGKRDIDKLL
jgi:plasmid stabilization system protein ParE